MFHCFSQFLKLSLTNLNLYEYPIRISDGHGSTILAKAVKINNFFVFHWIVSRFVFIRNKKWLPTFFNI